MKTVVIIAALMFASPLALAQDVVPQAPVYGGVVPVPPTPLPAPSALPTPPDYQPTPPPIPPGVSPVPGFAGQSAVGRPTLNTFTEQQIRTKLLANGYSNISGLSVDGTGTWHGNAVKDGGNVGVMIDPNGGIHP